MEYSSYQDLINYAKKECDSFSLVWRNEFKFDKSAWDITEELKPHLINEISTNKWPGTELFSGKALLRTYHLNHETVTILKRIESIFDWVAPNYPEDLAFYKKKKVIFASVAHEEYAWFE